MAEYIGSGGISVGAVTVTGAPALISIKIVDPDNGAGTDYTSLDAYEDDTGGVASGDLVTATTVSMAG